MGAAQNRAPQSGTAGGAVRQEGMPHLSRNDDFLYELLVFSLHSIVQLNTKAVNFDLNEEHTKV